MGVEDVTEDEVGFLHNLKNESFFAFYALWNAQFYQKVPRSWKKYFFDINNGLYFVSVPCTKLYYRRKECFFLS